MPNSSNFFAKPPATLHIENEVPINEVWWDGNDLREWGYDNGKEQEADLYLKIENPKYQDVLPANWKEARELRNQGYDGVITTDGKYLVFEKTQIKSVGNRGTFDENNPNIYYQKDNSTSLNFKSFEELQEAFKNDIEETPEDYKINNLEDALKDLGITENKPKEVKTPYETIQVRARNIEHIINSDSDKSRYKSINRMFATLERPNIITVNEQGKRAYFKIFGNNNKAKRQITYVSTDDLGNFVLTTIPVKKESWFLKQINNGEVVFDRRKGVINNSPVNNIINDNSRNFNPTTYKQEIQPSLFEGNNKAREIHKVKGSFMPAEKIIELFKNADISTIIHEYAHWYLSVMERYASISAEIEEDLNEVRKFVKNSGEEFTQEQHEKFARGFEAYIRSGNARSNRLKKIYEDLKNALLQIYDEITKIIYTENGIDKPFTEEDLPQIKGLFDRLLTTENERIQRTVFDKVDEINEKIKEIKENQIKEEQELDTHIQNDYNNQKEVSQDEKRDISSEQTGHRSSVEQDSLSNDRTTTTSNSTKGRKSIPNREGNLSESNSRVNTGRNTTNSDLSPI